MKKLISLILAAAMLLSLGVVAFATEISSGDMTSLKITVRKYWHDNDEKAHHDDVLADIYIEGKLAQTVTLSENNNWEAVAEPDIAPVPLLEKIDFIKDKIKVVERAVAGYKSSVYGPYEIYFGEDNSGGASYDIFNDKLTRVEIPVTVTVKQTGNVAPGSHTFYYDLMVRKNRPDINSLDAATQSDSSSYENDYKISYTGALTGDENGFSVTVDRKGTAAGTIVIEGDINSLYGLRGIISKRAQTAPEGWTYDESTYEFDIVEAELGDGRYETTYYMVKATPNGSSDYEYLGKGTAAYINEYKKDRVVNEDSEIIKITGKTEENPNTGASVYGIFAAVIAIGAAAIAIKVRK